MAFITNSVLTIPDLMTRAHELWLLEVRKLQSAMRTLINYSTDCTSNIFHMLNTNTATRRNVIYSRWFKYDRDKLWLVYTQIVPVIFEPPCVCVCVCVCVY
jgi:hypothetical protein